VTDGAVLPILHLNGFKISNPTVLARIEHVKNWTSFCAVAVGRPTSWRATSRRRCINSWPPPWTRPSRHPTDTKERPGRGTPTRPRWPMIVLRSPKGWTGPKFVDGLQIEGTFRSHQVPLIVDGQHPDHVELLESWMKSYKPEELFDDQGRLMPELAELAPKGNRRMGANPHANGGLLLRDLRMPDFHTHAVSVPSPGAVDAQDTRVLGKFLRDVAKLNQEDAIFASSVPTRRSRICWTRFSRSPIANGMPQPTETDEFLAPDGRVLDSMLSENQCEGWLEGYLLTGRHGLFNSYEAFIRIVDSMFSQHAKWLKVTAELPWRRKIASLNYLLASHVWQQDHNGFTHQDPGFLDHVINKKADVCACICRRTRTACCRSSIIVCAAAATSTSWWPASMRCRNGSPWTRRSCIAPKASASGNGRATTKAASRTSSWPVAATRRRWRSWPPFPFCANICPISKSG
jgi:xylulose-5-phosphate/fructose-6-phosphate phosphoketolase